MSDVSNWIQHTLIEYPGILYDSIHAATFLGISEKEFLSQIFENILFLQNIVVYFHHLREGGGNQPYAKLS